MIAIQEMLLTNHNRPKIKLKKLKAIVIHFTANFSNGSWAINNRNYFNTTSRGCSSQYIVDDHSIIRCIPEDEVAYHVGASKYTNYGESLREGGYSPNYFTIGIEMAVNQDGDYNKTYQNTIELVADILKRNPHLSINDVVLHHDITGKLCHKYYVEDSALWDKFKQDVINVSNPATQTIELVQRLAHVEIKPVSQTLSTDRLLQKGSQGDDVKELQENLNKLGYNCGKVDQIFGRATDGAVRRLQSENNLTSDGKVGSETRAKIQELLSNLNKPKEESKPVNQKVLSYQKVINSMGIKDKNGNRLSEDGILGSLTLSTIDKLPLLKVGSDNVLVGWIQGIVGCKQDNDYGNITKSKVIEYQKSKGISADGVVGKQTIKVMLDV